MQFLKGLDGWVRNKPHLYLGSISRPAARGETVTSSASTCGCEAKSVGHAAPGTRTEYELTS